MMIQHRHHFKHDRYSTTMCFKLVTSNKDLLPKLTLKLFSNKMALCDVAVYSRNIGI